VQALAGLDLASYIFKKNSPSCGVKRVKVYSAKGVPISKAVDSSAGALMRELPLLSVEEEGRLNDPALRENFSSHAFLPIIAGNDLRAAVGRSRL
jgi:uncharacterized protein YbbK (DUF523 family)